MVSGETDLSILYDEPSSLIHELTLNRNNNNKDNNLLRCPAVTDLGKNLFVLKNPVKTSASFVIEDGKVSSRMESKGAAWTVNRPPSLNNQLLAAYDYSIILYAEEDVEVMVSDPYFSQAQHKSWGTIIPGVYNCGAWFRPINMEFNVWPGITEVSLEQNEPMAYLKFFTDKNVVFERFTMTPELLSQAKACSSAGYWEPRLPLAKRYERFRRSMRDKFILNKIKNNLL
jgi:hypothetical protein